MLLMRGICGEGRGDSRVEIGRSKTAHEEFLAARSLPRDESHVAPRHSKNFRQQANHGGGRLPPFGRGRYRDLQPPRIAAQHGGAPGRGLNVYGDSNSLG